MLATKNYIDFQIVHPATNETLCEWSGARKANRCLPGDEVHFTTSEDVKLAKRVDIHTTKELVGILHLTSKYMYGMTSRNVPLYLCEPLNPGYPCFRVACKEKDRSQNKLVSFVFESWDEHAELPRGSLRSILGSVEDFEVEKYALALLSCPYTAPKPDSLPEFISADRIVLDKGTFNIDPLGCKDIDDVITILPNNTNQTYTVAITIADVAEFVYPGTKLFSTAQKIAATTYQNGTAVRPMLHPNLSENMCSLLPGKKRYGLSLFFTWSIEKGIEGEPFFEETLVTNQESYTYESIYDSDTVPVDILAGIASTLGGKKILDSHQWIEQLMIFYNKEAAKLLSKAGVGLLRIHDEPFQEKRKVLSEIDSSLEFLAYSSAKYAPVSKDSEKNPYHYGLSLELYCHASSPIRRFADLVNQHIIKHFLRKTTMTGLDSFDTLSIWLNKRQKEINSAERDFIFLQSIHSSSTNTVQGIYLWTKNGKAHLWIPSFQTIVKCIGTKDCTPGNIVNLAYYCDRSKAKWKDRMVITYSE